MSARSRAASEGGAAAGPPSSTSVRGEASETQTLAPTLRLVFVTASFPIQSERFIQREIEALRGLGAVVHVATLTTLDSGWPTLLAAPLACARTICGSPRRTWRTLKELVRARRGESSSLALSKRFLQSLHLADEISRMQAQLLHAEFLNAPAMVTRLAASWLGVPWGGSGHAHDLYVDRRGLAERLTGAAYLVACSEAGADELRALLPLPVARGVRCIHHGVPTPSARWSPTAENLIVAAGRFVPKKGFNVLIEALAKLRDEGLPFCARIAGEGDGRAALEASIERLDLRSLVTLEPWKSADELELLLREASVVVVPSTVAENGDRDAIPNVLVEALVLGVPVVTSASIAARELYDQGAVLTIPAEDHAELALSLRRVLSSRELSETLSQRGRAVALRQFDPRTNALKLLEVFSAARTLATEPHEPRERC